MRKSFGTPLNGLLAALDVGSSKVCCFIATVGDDGRPHVVGFGEHASRGVKCGSVVDLNSAEDPILHAVHTAERMAGDTVDRVVVNLSSGYPASRSIGVEVAIGGHEIADEDLHRALEQCRQAQALNGSGQSGRQLVHSIPIRYSIDGSRGVRDPRGMFGERLGVDMHVVTAASGAIRNLASCIQRCHLDVSAYVLSPYASGLAALVDDEKELGVTIIDMGAGTTSIAVFLSGRVIYTDVVPVGGANVTSDIARGLSTPLTYGERMKTLYGHAMATAADERELIDVPQIGEEQDPSSNQQVPRSLLVGIIQPRLEETFELVRSRLEASGLNKIAGRRVVLTGGASQLPGARDLAALVLDKQVRIGRSIRTGGLSEANSGPAYATCAGLLTYAIEEDLAISVEPWPETREPEGLLSRFGQWFREHF